MIGQLSGMGMNFYEPYDVAGYDAYHQFPIFHRSWISTNYLTKRYEFIRLLLDTAMMEPGAPKIDAYQYVFNKIPTGTAADSRELIKMLVTYWFPQSDNLTFDTTLDDNGWPDGRTSQLFSYCFH